MTVPGAVPAAVTVPLGVPLARLIADPSPVSLSLMTVAKGDLSTLYQADVSLVDGVFLPTLAAVWDGARFSSLAADGGLSLSLALIAGTPTRLKPAALITCAQNKNQRGRHRQSDVLQMGYSVVLQNSRDHAISR